VGSYPWKGYIEKGEKLTKETIGEKVVHGDW
jgi:hypothetical protein